jgi:uncharacterized ParB-like nuclease family protein
MATQIRFEHEDIATVPRGWKVRTVAQKDGTQVRMAFPPGRRKKGSGKVISILHPKVNPKSKTREQLEAMKAKAVKFLRDVAHASDKADEIDSMSVEDYAAKKKITLSNPRRRRNQDEADRAAKLYEDFHGKSATEILEVQDADIARDTYAVLGPLYEMKFKLDGQTYTFSFKGCDVKLASSADGNQLYCLGGDQDCEKLLPGPDTGKDLVDLGTVTHISYVTRKGFDKFKESIYEHKFGEEGGKRPCAWYARLAKRVLIGGGDYRVEAPGIID